MITVSYQSGYTSAERYMNYICCHMAIYIQTKYNAEWKDQERERLEIEELNNVEKANGQQNG